MEFKARRQDGMRECIDDDSGCDGVPTVRSGIRQQSPIDDANCEVIPAAEQTT